MLLRRVIFRYRVCVKLDFALLGSGIVSRDWIFVVCVIKIKFCFILAGYGILELDIVVCGISGHCCLELIFRNRGLISLINLVCRGFVL